MSVGGDTSAIWHFVYRVLQKILDFIDEPGGHFCKSIARFAEIDSPKSYLSNAVGLCSRH